MHPTALITGASSGIGWELAHIHAEHGGNLIVVARRLDRLQQLKKELEQKHSVDVTVIQKDLSTSHAAEELYQDVKSRNLKVDYLINNAAVGGCGFFQEWDWPYYQGMINLNVMELAGLTRLFLDDMIERDFGKILNVSSGTGFIPGPKHAVYYATKAFVNSFSEAVADEVSGRNITVTAFCPGATKTEFGNNIRAPRNKGFNRRFSSARKVAEYGYQAMLKGTPMAIYGLTLKIVVHGILRLLPRSVITKLSRANN